MFLEVLLNPLESEPVSEMKTQQGVQPQWGVFIENDLIAIVHEFIESFADIYEPISEVLIANLAFDEFFKQVLSCCLYVRKACSLAFAELSEQIRYIIE